MSKEYSHGRNSDLRIVMTTLEQGKDDERKPKICMYHQAQQTALSGRWIPWPYFGDAGLVSPSHSITTTTNSSEKNKKKTLDCVSRRDEMEKFKTGKPSSVSTFLSFILLESTFGESSASCEDIACTVTQTKGPSRDGPGAPDKT